MQLRLMQGVFLNKHDIIFFLMRIPVKIPSQDSVYLPFYLMYQLFISISMYGKVTSRNHKVYSEVVQYRVYEYSFLSTITKPITAQVPKLFR